MLIFFKKKFVLSSETPLRYGSNYYCNSSWRQQFQSSFHGLNIPKFQQTVQRHFSSQKQWMRYLLNDHFDQSEDEILDGSVFCINSGNLSLFRKKNGTNGKIKRKEKGKGKRTLETLDSVTIFWITGIWLRFLSNETSNFDTDGFSY
ncbi:hypothetical protein RIR_jg9107.t3 [Rhizophagus irregularis DAOM 181602=DAOM 197198]|nr:hypothetical protein RIR_jg9107.t3 [Rhizophagus irregularis DAOM 181602=DAOM 197198]